MAAGPVGIAGAEGVVADTGDGVCIGRVCAIGAATLGATSDVPRCGGAAPQEEVSGLVLRSLPNEPLPPLYPPRPTGGT